VQKKNHRTVVTAVLTELFYSELKLKIIKIFDGEQIIANNTDVLTD